MPSASMQVDAADAYVGVHAGALCPPGIDHDYRQSLRATACTRSEMLRK